MAFIPSIFTRDVSSSVAGFLAIRVTGSAISTFPYPYTTSLVREIEGKNFPDTHIIRVLPRVLFVYSVASYAEIYCFLRVTAESNINGGASGN